MVPGAAQQGSIDPRDRRWAPGAGFRPPERLVERPMPDDLRERARHEAFRRLLDAADETGSRLLLTGFLVFPANGLGDPPLRPALNAVIDHDACTPLLAALGAEGWRPTRVRGRSLLPPAAAAIEEPVSGAQVNLFPVIPGFFADPRVVFEDAWRRRHRMLVFGREAAITDRVLTMMLAVHDSAGPRANAPRPESETRALLDRFHSVITNDELELLAASVHRYRAEGVMRRLFGGLGLPIPPSRMPTRRYATARLFVDHVGLAGRLLLLSLESSPGYPGEVAADVVAARRRLARRGFAAAAEVPALLVRARRARRARLRALLAAGR